jgi:hypothetical protein
MKRAWSGEILPPRPRRPPSIDGTSPTTTSRPVALHQNIEKGIALGDGEDQGERAPTRRYGRAVGASYWRSRPRISGILEGWNRVSVQLPDAWFSWPLSACLASLVRG